MPIGNVDDITKRVESCLMNVRAIAAEDTRVAKQLIASLGIKSSKYYIRMDQYQEKSSFDTFDSVINQEDIAFVTDAGSPGISDPGAMLVQHCYDHNIQVMCLPGVSAVSTFISGMGILMDSFYFSGFFPRKLGARKQLLDFLVHNQLVGIWFESPKRILDLVEWLALQYPMMEIVLAKDLTKHYERYFKGRADKVFEALKSSDCRGEWIGCINGVSIDYSSDDELVTIAKQLTQLHLTAPQIKMIAKIFKLPKNKLVRLMLNKDD